MKRVSYIKRKIFRLIKLIILKLIKLKIFKLKILIGKIRKF